MPVSARSQHSCGCNDQHRCSTLISLCRDALNEDRKRDSLKLDNSGIKLKTSSSDGKVKKTGILEDKRRSLDPVPHRAYSCHLPYAQSLEKITDCSVKGVSGQSKMC